MEAVCSLETSVSVYSSTQRYNPEDFAGLKTHYGGPDAECVSQIWITKHLNPLAPASTNDSHRLYALARMIPRRNSEYFEHYLNFVKETSCFL